MKKFYYILIAIILIPFLIYGLIDQRIKDSKPSSSVTEAELLEKIISENNYIIIDVRTKEEYDTEHVIGAIHIAYNEFKKNTDSYAKLYDGKDIIIYSSDGSESNLACNTLIESGFGAIDLGAYDSITLEKENGNGYKSSNF